MSWWREIYTRFDPVAFELFGLKVHWYGLMYITALVLGLYLAKYFAKKDNYPLNQNELDNYFIYVEIGVILGARLGYILFYDPHTYYYLTHPWQIFNPFLNGEFVGIRGMSYHGAMIGFLLSTMLYAKIYKKSSLMLLDLTAISVPLAYVFGRIGNFLNKELIGRQSDVAWAIDVNGVLRHPSQLYEAFLEGVVLFLVINYFRKRKSFDGELIAIYGIGYGVARFIVEFYRQPDFQLGFICCGWMSMGQLLSIIMMIAGVLVYIFARKRVVK
jgi:phosphatidylglycerol:prolipoprotein diacylglycerol transferase